MSSHTQYDCSAETWTVIESACNDGTSDYKLMIDNSDSDDGVWIDTAFMNIGSTTYTIDAWCIPDGEEPVNSLQYSPDDCNDGYTAYDSQCVDNDYSGGTYACAPERILLHFDMDNPNGTSYSAEYEDATIICEQWDDDFLLIEQHLNATNGMFNASVLETGIENQDDPTENTYCIIGKIEPDDWLFDDGYYWLQLIYRYSDGTTDVLEWTQESWITEETIIGADLFGVSDDSDYDELLRFYGLGLSSDSNTYLDGNGGDEYWYHAVASTSIWNGGIPGHQSKTAYSSALYLRSPCMYLY